MSDQATALGPKFFVLGAFSQASWMIDTWKARGVNTLVEAPQGHDVLQWAQAADTGAPRPRGQPKLGHRPLKVTRKAQSKSGVRPRR